MKKHFLDVMSLDDIKQHVNLCKKGTWYSIMILDGSPIALEGGNMLYVTETFKVRFGINYGNIAHIRCRNMIKDAWNAETVHQARMAYDGLKHKAVLSDSFKHTLEYKEKEIAAGRELPKPVIKEVEDTKKRDKDCPALVYCNNGEITLTCYMAFQNKIKGVKGGFVYDEVEPEIRYFIRRPDNTYFEFPVLDEKTKSVMEKARITARSIADKKEGGITAVITPRARNILNLGKRKEW